ncbi:MAG: DNA primase [Anaerolineae bacterium]|nr:DNA primase [Anaerolineae bacterium]NUQ03562.1 DNA primase [Anaerolineae bacterium]
MSTVDEIKSRLDIVQYIQQYVPLKKQGRYLKAPCPFHSEKTPSFVVNEDRQTWRCFGACAEGGDIFRFAMKYHGWTFSEALEELARRAGVELHKPSPEQRAQQDELDRLRGLLKHAAEYFQDHLFDRSRKDSLAVMDYARRKRGLTDETLSHFQIGYAPEGWRHLLEAFTALGYAPEDLLAVGLVKQNEKGDLYDVFRNRLMIPICDERGRVVGFGARALAADDNPKYLNSPQTPVFDKGRLLFALDFAKEPIRADGSVVIVEGYMDAISAHQAGYNNVVAQMGTSLTEAQLRLVVPRLAKRVIMALDSDPAGQNATRRSLEVAREVLQADYAGRLSVDMRVLQIPGAKDPDDLIREMPGEWANLVAAALPVAEFVIDLELAQLPSSPSVQEREAAARRLLPILMATEDSIYQSANVQLLALRLKMDERRLLNWASDIVAIEQRAPRPQPPKGAEASDRQPEPPELLEPPMEPVSAASPALPNLPTEDFCLRAFFVQPSLLYDVNRKLRELAAEDDALLQTVLTEFAPEDFTRDNNRALMGAFLEAMAQNDSPPLEYLGASLPDSLIVEAQRIMTGEWDRLRPLLRYGLSADLEEWLARYGEGDSLQALRAALIDQSLRLRAIRLQREREEIGYMRPEDGFDENAISSYIARSLRAKQLIDAELSRRTRFARS